MPARSSLRRAGMLCRPSWQAVSATLQSRSNQVRNNSGQGAVAGTPGTLPTNWSFGGAVGLTTSVVGTGTGAGIDYLDVRLAGTTGGTFAVFLPEASANIAAANGQAWFFSAFMAIAGGNATNITSLSMTVRQQDSGGATLSDLVAVVDVFPLLSGTLRRVGGVVTTNNASTAFVRPLFGFTYNSAVAIDITLRVGGTMLHQGTAALSPIRTSTTARTGVHSSTTGRL